MISVSIVSHMQSALVADLLADIASMQRGDLEILVTLNVPEDEPLTAGIPVEFIRNANRMGFGANHNQAFRRAKGELFCIVNPDVRLPVDPFPALLDALRRERAGLVAPRVLSAAGNVENSARRFPTAASLASKLVGIAPALDYPDTEEIASPDWVAGMFMLARMGAFRSINGFDERYFLYYEDVDLCRRMRAGGWDILLAPQARIVHDARRTSHRNLRYLLWHLRSAARYLSTRYR